VRNFVALARASYYNGLEFDRTYNETSETASFQCLIGGCPEGTGEVGLGSIGYWMIPELNDAVKHEIGTVGAWHDPEQVETGACKFYITLSKAANMDGDYSVFGQVTQGLDVLRTILSRPVEQNDLKNRPLQPVIIREVTIDCREVEAVQPPR
jgi:cyclophilin family peptidyl-prolyl cis-trans isomerase